MPRKRLVGASKLTMEDWNETMRLLRESPEEGAKALLRDYGPRLYATAFRLCQNETAAEDLMFRTIERVTEKIAAFNGKSSFFTWMCAIMANFLRMDMRKKGANSLVFGDDAMPEGEDACPTPAESAEASDDAAAVRRAVAALPQNLRTVVVLSYFDGMAVTEVAKALAVPEGTAHYWLHEAKKRIRAAIDPKGNGFGRI